MTRCTEFRRFAGEGMAGEPVEVPCDCDDEETSETPLEAFNAAVERALAREQLTETVGDPLLKRRAA
jgi:hypothetical protein